MMGKSLRNDDVCFKKIIYENYKRVVFNVNEAKEKYNRKDDIRIMAVTKTVEPEFINHAISLGIGLLGENRVQEYLSKHDKYTGNPEIHFIGRLQSNKVKYIIDKVDLIQSVDSLKLAAEIDRQAGKRGTVMKILFEVNIGNEVSKMGFIPEYDVLKYNADELIGLSNLRLCGLMTIPPFDSSVNERYFEKMRNLFEKLKAYGRGVGKDFSILSMGMSGDYLSAIKYGSNIIRIGTSIFGQRQKL
ncbi:MAG: YggS family pyridoxal phosphate-dependent enzyme [Eubacterium sp.]|jgi:pyridoxal phosphate enzyme (YggS family)|nr:YggS family pyridoxal phosphate-dependent enzyme [Eubacterium sp.]